LNLHPKILWLKHGCKISLPQNFQDFGLKNEFYKIQNRWHTI
jgi:hypothetical protein